MGSGQFAISTNGNTLFLDFVQAPTVTARPAVFSVSSGHKAIINAITTGSQLTYLWQLNNGSLTADAAGQGTANLTISPAQDADAGTYTVQASNPLGAVSASSELVVVDPAVFAGPPGARTFTLNFSGPVNQNYRIWSSTDLTLPVLTAWNLVGGGTFNSGVNSFTDTSATSADNYYCITVP